MIMYRPRYDTVTGTFHGLYRTLGYTMVRGNPQEHFLDYEYSKQNCQILHLHYKKRIPSSFRGTLFNRQRIQFESGALQSTFSNLYFFTKSIYRIYTLVPIDISEKTFEVEENISFDPLKLDFECPENEKIAKAIVKMLKNIIDVLNANLVEIADDLLSKKLLMRRSLGLTKTKSTFLIIHIKCHTE